jgi:hypothetical protein
VGLFSFTDQELAAKEIEKGAWAWGSDLRVFTYRLSLAMVLKNDPSVVASMVASGFVDQGWRLHSVTPFINKVGPDSVDIWMTFERPTAAPPID